MKMLLGTKKSVDDARDYIAENILSDEIDVPMTLDLSPLLPPVRDQGEQGSCSAQVAACIKEYQERVEIQFRDHMSPQFIYNNRDDLDSEGMSPRETFKIMHKLGSVPEEKYPYGTQGKPVGVELQTLARRFRIKSYAQILTIEGVKKILKKNGPAYIAFPVYNYGPDMWNTSTGHKKLLGGHAMAITGYTRKGFKVRNTWSTLWGNEGYTIYKFSDWGKHWEVWSTIDERSSLPEPDYNSVWKKVVRLFRSVYNFFF